MQRSNFILFYFFFTPFLLFHFIIISQYKTLECLLLLLLLLFQVIPVKVNYNIIIIHSKYFPNSDWLKAHA